MLNIEKYKDEILCIGEYETYMNANNIDYKQGCRGEEVLNWLCAKYGESLTEDEKEYLRKLQEVLSIKICGVCKKRSKSKPNLAYLLVEYCSNYERGVYLYSPSFEENKMFTYLGYERFYTYEELEL